jgi:hypothetical protein
MEGRQTPRAWLAGVSLTPEEPLRPPLAHPDTEAPPDATSNPVMMAARMPIRGRRPACGGLVQAGQAGINAILAAEVAPNDGLGPGGHRWMPTVSGGAEFPTWHLKVCANGHTSGRAEQRAPGTGSRGDSPLNSPKPPVPDAMPLTGSLPTKRAKADASTLRWRGAMLTDDIRTGLCRAPSRATPLRAASRRRGRRCSRRRRRFP